MDLQYIKQLLNTLIGTEFTALLGKLYYWAVVPVLSQPTLHWFYLLVTVVIAWLFYLFAVSRSAGARPGGFRAFLLPKAVWGHPSAIVDYKFYVVTQFVLTYLRVGQFVVGLASVLFVAEGVRSALEFAFGTGAVAGRPSWPAIAAFTVLTAIAFDFGRFITHYLHHRIPLLWEFHKVHHSAAVLTPMSSFRTHPVEQMLEFLVRLVLTGSVSGAFTYFYPSGIQELTILNYSADLFLYSLTGHFRHSHIPLGFGRFSRYFVSPVMHQLHHSQSQAHFDRNFGFILTLWDRMIGTMYIPRRDESWELGLPADAGRFDSVTALYVGPFVRAARLLRNPRQAFIGAGS